MMCCSSDVSMQRADVSILTCRKSWSMLPASEEAAPGVATVPASELCMGSCSARLTAGCLRIALCTPERKLSSEHPTEKSGGRGIECGLGARL